MALYLLVGAPLAAAAALAALRLLLPSTSSRFVDPAAPARTLQLPGGRTLGYACTEPSDGGPVRRVALHFHCLPGSRLSLPPGPAPPGTLLVCVDRPGVGLSSTWHAPPSFRSFAADVSRLVDAVLPPGAELVATGHSAGCLHALALAATDARVSRVALFGPIVTPWVVGVPEFDWKSGMRPASAGMTEMLRDRPGLARWIVWALAPFLVDPEGSVKDIDATEKLAPEVAEGVRRAAAECFRQGVAGMAADLVLCGSGRWDFFPGDVGCPVAIVVGEKDAFTPPAMARCLAGVLPDASLEVVQGQGHFGLFFGQYMSAIAG